MVFPVFKLTGLVVKSVSKPLAAAIKQYSRDNPKFTKSCQWIAHRYYSSYNMMCRTLRIPYQVTPITNEQAVNLGIDLIGEGVVLSVAAGVIYYEYNKSSKLPSKCDLLDARLRRIEDHLNLSEWKD